MAENILSAACQSESPQESEMFEDPDHPKKVLEGLNRLRLNGLLCDVILCCEEQEVPCHRYVLASLSSYFETVFTYRESTQERVTIRGVEPHVIDLLVNYVYTSKVSISTANVQALLASANMWDITSVRNACSDFMKRRMDDTDLFEDPDHPNKLLEGLNRLRVNRMRLSSALCDVILCCEGQEFPCHRYVLASFCSYFEAMFTSGMRESTQDRVTISEVEPQIIGLLVNYAYTSELSISTANVQALLAASNLWDITAVRNACCDFMKRRMDRNNSVGIYCFSEDHSCDMLRKHSMDYILEHFSVIYQQEEFLALPVEQLAEILASDHLNVPEEDMVFEAAMLWLDKCPTRKQSFGQVLEQIRLPLISPCYLPTVVLCLDVVKEQQGCQRFISEAKGEQPYSNTARPRRTTEVIVTVGVRYKDWGFAKVESFDGTGSWKTLGFLPFKLQHYAVVASGSTLYVAGGQRDGSASKEMWRCDVHDNSWLKMAPMKMARLDFSLVELDGYVFAVGGSGSEKSKATIERYDPQNDTWKLLKSAVPVAYRDAIVLALERWIYFIGSVQIGSDQISSDRVAKYHPVRSVWKKIVPFDLPIIMRRPSAACVLNGKIYVTGSSYCNCFNPKTNQWTECNNDKVLFRYGINMAVLDGQIYVLGGMDENDCHRHVEGVVRYCAETDKWETADWRRLAHYDFKCVTLRLRSDHVPMVDSDDESCNDYSGDDDYCADDYYSEFLNGDWEVL